MKATTCRAALCAFVLLTASAMADDTQPVRTVTVTGVGRVAATPDLAKIDIVVVARAKSAAEAMRVNSNLMNRLLATLDARGVTALDRQTANFQIMPEYRYESREDRTTPDGYTVRNTLTLKIRNVAATGEILDALVEAGANQVDGVTFAVQDEEPLLDEARRAAVSDARRKAELLATSAGASLGTILTMTDVGWQPGPPQMLRSELIGAAASAPIEAGEAIIDARVTTVWELVPRASTGPQ